MDEEGAADEMGEERTMVRYAGAVRMQVLENDRREDQRQQDITWWRQKMRMKQMQW